jgi:hypothetical protein
MDGSEGKASNWQRFSLNSMDGSKGKASNWQRFSLNTMDWIKEKASNWQRFLGRNRWYQIRINCEIGIPRETLKLPPMAARYN